jgi:hypothetical protein
MYYQHDMFKCMLEDLSLLYFGDIGLNENIRLEYILRHLNFTLEGENYGNNKLT